MHAWYSIVWNDKVEEKNGKYGSSPRPRLLNRHLWAAGSTVLYFDVKEHF